jgi:hypothetical protein
VSGWNGMARVLFSSDDPSSTEPLERRRKKRMKEKDMQVLRSWARPLAAAAFSAAWIVSVAPASAQTQAPNPQTQNPQTQNPQTQMQPSNIPDQKLDAAAAAVDQVSTIKQTYQEKLTSAPPAEKERIATEANDAMAKAVTEQGLSVEEYNSIIQVAQNDPQLRQKILQRIKKK